MDDTVLDYAVRICRNSRRQSGVILGAGPRATISLVRAARAEALLEGRDFVVPDDIKRMVPPVLRHRIQLSPEMEIEGASPDVLLTQLLDNTDAPRT